MNFNVGERIYYHHPEHSWVLGTVTATDGKTYTCKTDDSRRAEAKQGEEISKVLPAHVTNAQLDTLDEEPHDLLDLTLLHDSTLLRCLYTRYMKDYVYTNIGAIVVALNPFNFKIPWYQDDQMPKYLAEGPQIEENIPHSWAQAHNTYYDMVTEQSNQSILISGESGAGKTEATKIVMKYLAQVSCLRATDEVRVAGSQVGLKLSACSPILEAFGNAKTVRNDNSSRFGKFMKVKFSAEGVLVGSHTTKYLLEKSRIITAAPDERVYHAFYIVVRGELRSSLGLQTDKSYKSINSGGCLHNKEFDTREDFEEVCQAMDKLGMEADDVLSAWRVPAAVLSLQNVNFANQSEDACAIDPKTDPYLRHAAEVLKIDETRLREELLTKTITLPSGTVTKPNNMTAATDTRDALCKGIYDGVFGWLVDQCNALCDVESTGPWIGLLDIFGFEDFKVNSFEQLCINLTNETLQNHYNNYIFTKDMEDCKREGIDVTEVKCPDNAPCLKLISAKGGILPLLDEECLLGKGTELAFIEKVTQAHDTHEFFARKKTSRNAFMIHHYAATVTYTVDGWLDKNRDTLKDAMKLLIRDSEDRIVSNVLPEPIPQDKKRGAGLTVGGFFNQQLKSLMEVINGTNPHWIRCVKPHPAKKPKMFHGVSTMNQLESSGVLGTVKIRKAGYPVRIPHAKFVRRYNLLLQNVEKSEEEQIKEIMSTAQFDARMAQNGATKVFLKSEAYQKMERLRDLMMVDWAMLLQRIGRGCLGRGEMFHLYIEARREQIVAERRAREEAERAAREKEERQRREAEERERLEREAEERRLRDEAERLANARTAAAIKIQKHIRGVLTRVAVFRRVLEESRAKFEAQVETQMVLERHAAMDADIGRHRAERQWIAYLNELDQLSRYRVQERQRVLEKREQRFRIQRREAEHKEQAARRLLFDEEITERQTLLAKCEIIAKNKADMASTRMRTTSRLSSAVHRRQQATTMPGAPARHGATPGGVLRPNSSLQQSRRVAAATSDARSEQVLRQYAVNQARAFAEYFPEPTDTTYTARPGDPAVDRPDPRREKLLFERSRNRWAHQETFLASQNAAADPAARRPPMGAGMSLSEAAGDMGDEFSGPFRVSPSAGGSGEYGANQDYSTYNHPAMYPSNVTALHQQRGTAPTYSAPRFMSPATTAGATPSAAKYSGTAARVPPWVLEAAAATGPGGSVQQPQMSHQYVDATRWDDTA